MYPTDDEYKDAIKADLRSIDVFLRIGYGIDNTAADDISSTEASMLPMSSASQMTDAIYSMNKSVATFEGYGIPTAVSMGMTVPPITSAETSMEVGVWSDVISDSNGAIDWTITLSLSKAHTSAFTVYTGDVHILSAIVTYMKDGAQVWSGMVEPDTDMLQIDDILTYDDIIINVTRIDAPFRHVRIIEVEFGSSVSYSKNAIRGELRYVSERDSTGESCPLDELTFDLVNEDWMYDFDAPTRQNDSVNVGKPITLSFTVHTASGQRTVSCGKFYIRDIDMHEGIAKVTADDPRVIMTDVRKAWSIPTTMSIGTAIDDVCEELFIDHVCDDSLYSIYPTRDISFDGDSSYMEDILQLMQFLQLEMVPDHSGTLRFHPYADPQQYGAVLEGQMLTYPQKKTNLSTYNMVSVWYGESPNRATYDRDLREAKTAAVNQLTVNNPLVVTKEEAMAICNHIVANLYNSELDVDWIGDPALQVGDMVSFPGRFSDATPRRVEYQEITYNGGLRAKTSVVY